MMGRRGRRCKQVRDDLRINERLLEHETGSIGSHFVKKSLLYGGGTEVSDVSLGRMCNE